MGCAVSAASKHDVADFEENLANSNTQNARNKKALTVAELQVPQTSQTSGRTVEILDGAAEVLRTDPSFRKSPASTYFFKVLTRLPREPETDYFNSPSEAEAWMSYLADACNASRVAPEGEWGDMTSDDNFARFMMIGNGSIFLHRLPDEGTTKAGYVCKLNFLGDFRVRPGYERYGADSYFDASGKVTHIDVLSQIVRPGDSQWEFAKIRARTSAFAMASGTHLAEAHYKWGNIPHCAIQKHLHHDHPIYRLLAPHYTRSALTALDSCDTINPEMGMIHRSTTFEWEPKGLKSIFVTLAGRPWKTWREDLDSRGMLGAAEVDDLYCPLGDSLDLIARIRVYVMEYCDVYYADGDQADEARIAVSSDDSLRNVFGHCRKWWSNFPAVESKEDLVYVLTEFIFRVTGWHQHIGNVNLSGTSPAAVCPHMKAGRLYGALLPNTILAIISYLTAGMVKGIGDDAFPSLIDDWSHLLHDDEKGIKAREAFQRFHLSMLEYADVIEKRNAALGRGRRWINNDFNPQFCKISIAS
eukprot:g5819.t1